jgi:hypothetical protein
MNEFRMTFITNSLFVKLWQMQIGLIENRKSRTRQGWGKGGKSPHNMNILPYSP